MAYTKYRVLAFNSAGRSWVQILNLVQESHFEGFGIYYSDVNEFKKQFVHPSYPDDDSISIYLSPEDVPKEYINYIETPFLSEKAYVIIVAVKNKYDKKRYFWVARNGKDLELVSGE